MWRLRVALAATAAAQTSQRGAFDDPSFGNCNCDVTPEVCDAFCCCDPDCGSLADESQTCLVAASERPTSHMCYSPAWLREVNPRADLTVVLDDLHGLLCVTVDNSLGTSEYFVADPIVSGAEVTRVEQGIAGFGAVLQAARTQSSGALQDSSPLWVHRVVDLDKVQTVRLSTADNALSGLDTAYKYETVHPVRLGRPHGSGSCQPQAAFFLQPMRPATCVRQLPSLRHHCRKWRVGDPHAPSEEFVGTLDSFWAFTGNVERQPLAAGVRCGADGCLAPTLECYVRDPLTLQEEPIADCSLEILAAYQTNLTEAAGACTCENALVEEQWVYTYERDAAGAAALVGTFGRLVLQAVQAESCDAAVEVPVKTALDFTVANTTDTVASAFARAGVAHGGAPGYQVGLPLIAARCAQADGANCVALSPVAAVAGVDFRGRCKTVAEAATLADNEFAPPLRFGEDMVLQCTLPLNREELRSLCCDIERASENGDAQGEHSVAMLAPHTPIDGVFFEPVSYIGAFGDADATIQPRAGARTQPQAQLAIQEQFIKVTVHYETPAPQWEGESTACDSSQALSAGVAHGGACTDIITGLDYTIMYQHVGNKVNPQKMVVAAEARYRKSSLRHDSMSPLDEQDFTFRLSVTYVRKPDAEDTQTVVPPRPKIPLYLPPELWYPFSLVNRGAPAAVGGALLLLAALRC